MTDTPFIHDGATGYRTKHSMSDLMLEARVRSNPVAPLVALLFEKGVLSDTEVLDVLHLHDTYRVAYKYEDAE